MVLGDVELREDTWRRLRDAVRRAVSQHPYVDRFESGGVKEGGDGVTVVFLVKG